MKNIMIVICFLTSSLFGAEFSELNRASSAHDLGIGNIRGFSKSANTIFDNPAGMGYSFSLSMFYTESMQA